jgi:hypothetical protein
MDNKLFEYGVDKTNEFLKILIKNGIEIKTGQELIIHNFIVGLVNDNKVIKQIINEKDEWYEKYMKADALTLVQYKMIEELQKENETLKANNKIPFDIFKKKL